MSQPSSDLGFIQVGCTACNNPDVWFTCNSCSKSDHFALKDDHVACDCGSTYTTGICSCKETVPFVALQFVPFDKGPMALADLEVAWGRVVGLGVVAVVVLVGISYAVFS